MITKCSLWSHHLRCPVWWTNSSEYIVLFWKSYLLFFWTQNRERPKLLLCCLQYIEPMFPSPVFHGTCDVEFYFPFFFKKQSANKKRALIKSSQRFLSRERAQFPALCDARSNCILFMIALADTEICIIEAWCVVFCQSATHRVKSNFLWVAVNALQKPSDRELNSAPESLQKEMPQTWLGVRVSTLNICLHSFWMHYFIFHV